jgi:hypothetical protein
MKHGPGFVQGTSRDAWADGAAILKAFTPP